MAERKAGRRRLFLGLCRFAARRTDRGTDDCVPLVHLSGPRKSRCSASTQLRLAVLRLHFDLSKFRRYQRKGDGRRRRL